MTYLLQFLAGALLCNCIPHLVAGLQGRLFPTPFAKPRGVGNSLPLINFAWGSANLLLGFLVVSGHLPLAGPLPDSFALALGFLATGSEAYPSGVHRTGQRSACLRSPLAACTCWMECVIMRRQKTKLCRVIFRCEAKAFVWPASRSGGRSVRARLAA